MALVFKNATVLGTIVTLALPYREKYVMKSTPRLSPRWKNSVSLASNAGSGGTHIGDLLICEVISFLPLSSYIQTFPGSPAFAPLSCQ